MPHVSPTTAPTRLEEGPVHSLSDELDGGYTVNFVRFGPDMDHTPLLQGLPDDRCQCPHWGYVLEGRFTYRFADSEETVEAGEAFYLPPGHIPIGNAPNSRLVQFSPTDDLRAVNAVLMKNVAALSEQSPA